MLICGSYSLSLARPLVMGIVNVTPDSFADGGQHVAIEAALAHAQCLIAEGADILDIGGESTRPGAAPVSLADELARVIPLIEALRGIAMPISIDTYKPEVMAAAIRAGASMVNDINALQDPAALAVVAAHNVAVCLMHKQGEVQTMQAAPRYRNVVDEVREFLRARVEACEAVGIESDRLVIDPGFGFGKSVAHNFAMLGNLSEFAEIGVPVLAGLSRKSMLGEVTGQPVEQRLSASVAAALIAVQRGAELLRVHDVRATVDALKIWSAVN
ncbi:MAG: dihydropteroate synthase [Sideroxydans sp.]|nr:dihydropteroate synthase [Sideroxydans sp.]